MFPSFNIRFVTNVLCNDVVKAVFDLPNYRWIALTARAANDRFGGDAA